MSISTLQTSSKSKNYSNYHDQVCQKNDESPDFLFETFAFHRLASSVDFYEDILCLLLNIFYI